MQSYGMRRRRHCTAEACLHRFTTVECIADSDARRFDRVTMVSAGDLDAIGELVDRMRKVTP